MKKVTIGYFNYTKHSEPGVLKTHHFQCGENDVDTTEKLKAQFSDPARYTYHGCKIYTTNQKPL